MDISATDCVATYYAIPESEVFNDSLKLSPTDLAAKFKVTTFKTTAGGNDLYMQVNGSYLKWNPSTQKFM